MYERNIKLFQEKFKPYQDKKIVLYGIGGCTQALLDAVQGQYNFIGLLDRDESLIGQIRYNIPIVDRKTAEGADLVVISTLECYWNIIYNRIKDWNVSIYTMDGRFAREIETDDICDNDVYWEKSKDELSNIVNQYDIVSFDIFDTLLMRKIYDPRDLLLLVEEKLKDEFGEAFSYVELRNQAVRSLENPTIDELYEKIQEISGWTRERINYIKNVEVDTDRKLIVPRRDMAQLFEEANKSKKVFLISDMYYTAEMLRGILTDTGIKVDINQLIVSCDVKRQKQDSTLWKWYKSEYVGNKKALHIGDNKKSDIDCAYANGIDAYHVLSSAAMLEKSSYATCVPEIKTVDDSIFIGVLISRIFNSPFALCKTRGKVDLTNERDAGCCLYGVPDFINEMIQIYEGIERRCYKNNHIFIDKLYGVMLEGGFEMTQEMLDAVLDGGIKTKLSEGRYNK